MTAFSTAVTVASPVARTRTVSPAIDPATGVGSVRVALAPPASPGDPRPPIGLAGQAEIVVSEGHPALMVPASSVRNAGGAKTEVVACAAGHAAVREVETGTRTDGGVEITKGIEPGIKVITDQVGAVEDGAAIEEVP